MNKKIILVLVCLVIAVFALGGCVETLKQEAISGNYENKEISSNGGLAVEYGDYLYFVNGFASEEDENTFGKVTKGAISRVELDENRAPKKDTFTVVVPKKVYSTEKNYGGLYIYNDYIYYSTTSITKDSEGNPKTSEMVIMRTKVDGTDSQKIAEFSSHSVPYQVRNNSLVYIEDQKVYRIDLTNKKFTAKLVEEGLDTAYFFTKTSKESNVMDNYVIYSKTDEDTTKKTFTAVSIDGNKKVDIISSDMIGTGALFTPKILDIKYLDDKLTVFYDITDNRTNAPLSGIYSYTYSENLDFKFENMVRYTNNSSSTAGFEYTKFFYIGGKVVALGTEKDASDESVSKMDVYNTNGEREYKAVSFKSSIAVYDIYLDKTENAYYMYYTASEQLNKIKLFDIVEGVLTKAEGNAVVCYSGQFSSEWIPAEIINGKLYFFSSNVSNNIYYLNLDEIEERNPESRKASALGKIIDRDRIAAF